MTKPDAVAYVGNPRIDELTALERQRGLTRREQMELHIALGGSLHTTARPPEPKLRQVVRHYPGGCSVEWVAA